MIDKKKIKKEYQRTHPKCDHCIWFHPKSRCGEFFWEECDLKEKTLIKWDFLRVLEARLCKQYYMVEEEDNEISTNKNN